MKTTILSCALLAMALAGAAGCTAPAPTAPAAATSGPRAATGGDDSPAISVYDANGARVVNIISASAVPSTSGGGPPRQGVGSGFVYDTAGHIITNDHVLQDAAELQVTFKDRTTKAAKLVGRDPETDLAVIQVDNLGDVTPVTLGDSDTLRIGQLAFAIGSPLGLQQTMTQGIVSALRIPGEDTTNGIVDLLGGAVQTDASINPGNSGGPLFNAAGEVIGVNTAILSQSGGNEGLGLAIPINVVKRVVPQLIETGHYRHPQLGIIGISLSVLGAQARQQLGIPATAEDGIYVVQVSDAAQQAGVRAGTTAVQIGAVRMPAGGDVITAIDGRTVSTPSELRAYIDNAKHPGDVVTLTILRGGQEMSLPVTLGERPQATP